MKTRPYINQYREPLCIHGGAVWAQLECWWCSVCICSSSGGEHWFYFTFGMAAAAPESCLKAKKLCSSIIMKTLSWFKLDWQVKRKEHLTCDKVLTAVTLPHMTFLKCLKHNQTSPRPCRGLSGVHIMCTDDGWMDGQQWSKNAKHQTPSYSSQHISVCWLPCLKISYRPINDAHNASWS